VVEHLLADGDDVGRYVRVWIPSGTQRIGDDARAFVGCDEKKIVAEVLNRRIDVRRISEGAEAARHIEVAAGGVGGIGEDKQGTQENRRIEN